MKCKSAGKISIFIASSIDGYIAGENGELDFMDSAHTEDNQAYPTGLVKLCYDILNKNEQKFAAIKKLNLPLGQYIITGSGALGARNLREIGDIDILVVPELWKSLAEKYGVVNEGVEEKVVFPDGLIEALWEGSFVSDDHAPTIKERLLQADMIDGLPFESLEHVLYYKRKMGRDKDLKDILIIEKFLEPVQNLFDI